MAPINDLLKSKKTGQRIQWTDEAEKVFKKVKQALISTPILTSPDFNLPFTVQCDASDTGLGSVLTQKQDGQERYPPYYHPQANYVERASRTIGTAIRSYIKDDHKLCDKELPCIAYALRTAVHEVTGYSPAFFNFGREVPCSGKHYGKGESNLDLVGKENWVQNLGKMSDLSGCSEKT
ncbi:hypothetical protein JTB14_010148 [Gonioctena quinquepunctata]|nr:hypothetical protein JTB14_010148 [Gonioctena quinquepunctata]